MTIIGRRDGMRAGDVLARSILGSGIVAILLLSAPEVFPREKPSSHGAALRTGRELIDNRKDGDSLDRAIRMLEEDAARQPNSLTPGSCSSRRNINALLRQNE